MKRLNIKREYRPDDNIVKSFYIPLLQLAQTYDRAVGFFSSTILAEIAIGITEIAKKCGKIRIVASPHLSEEDITAIKRGYEKRDDIIRKNIIKNLKDPENEFEKAHLNLLANLIADNILDIKIAFTEKNTSLGMYHEKMGIIRDSHGNRVAFSGSLNETLNAVNFNYETIDVFCSWKPEDVDRVEDKVTAFNRIWNNSESKAIEAGWLTHYYYFPVIVTLEDDEREKYVNLSREISKCVIYAKDGKKCLSERGKKLALQRSRIISGARQKLIALRREIEPYKDDKYILVYCGATNVLLENQDISATDEMDVRQVEAVSSILGNDLGIKSSRFTSDEDMKERKMIKEQFSLGNLQALVAIKCLDEGVNIPAIRTAFILASTTNPKEYIQRRGRVLRLSKGKNYACIYDFITLPRDIKSAHYLTDSQTKMELSLIRSEIKRAEEFARISMNKMDAIKIIDSIKEAYSIDKYLLFDEEVL